MVQDTITQVVETRTAELQREAVRLRGEHAAIEERLTAIDGELSELEIAVRVYRRFSNGTAPASLGLEDAPDRTIQLPTDERSLPDMSNMTLADAAATVLRTYGPGHSRDLRHALIAAGKLPATRNSYGYLLKVLRDKPERFDKDEHSSMWSLREERS